MSDRDDDLLISGAFLSMNAEAEPFVRPAGSSAVRASAKHKQRNRAIVTAVAAALLVAAPAVTYATFKQNGQVPPPPASSATPQPTTSFPFESATFVSSIPTVDLTVHFYSGGQVVRTASWEDDDQGSIEKSLAVSRDGLRIAFVNGDGDLMVSLLGEPTKRLRQLVQGGGYRPVWAPDGASIYTGAGRIDATTGQILSEEKWLDMVWSANGQFFAHRSGDRVVVRSADGNFLYDKLFTCVQECGTAAQSPVAISNDGKYVATSSTPTDDGRPVAWHHLIDFGSEEANELEFSWRGLQAHFLDLKSAVVLHGDKLIIWDLAGNVVQQAVLPDDLRPTQQRWVYFLGLK